ncbi:RagB/SusD family nutrient uptake outer membrane protein [Chitinophaga niabensis]|uniref:RagB/SusD family nutrient uptake outer membrane protein n=1 Tax=Chitinophaga niabensis TaxID=536979 RepID=UPI0031BA1344
MAKGITYVAPVYKVIVVLSMLCLSTSCDKDWLDEKPDKNLTVPETLNDFEAMLDNTAINGRSALSIGEVASDGHYVLESRWASGFDNNLVNAYTWTKNRPNIAIVDWNSPYNFIIVSNVILEGAEKIESTASISEQRNRIIGGALFNRSRQLFELAQVFIPPFNTATASSDIGLPIRTEADITIPTVRSTVKETYDRIIADLLIAKDLLPTTPRYKTRASKPAVFAQLARVYLSMKDYSNAGKYADSCLKIYSTLLDYSKINLNANFIGVFNDEVIFHSLGSAYNILTSSAKIDKSLFDTYAANDLRKKAFFRTESAGTIIFKGNYSNNSTSYFFGLATDEVYLIRAEALARSGAKEDALKYLNLLLKRRYDMTFAPVTAVDANDALVKILKERKKELFLRGQRWTDLRRLNTEQQFSEILTRTIGGNTYTLEPNSYKYTFPIPDDVVQLSGIQQNSGWAK